MSRILSRLNINLPLVAITAIAAFYRLYRLDQFPPGFQFDQAYYVFDVLRLLQGQFYVFFATPGGSEPLYLYLAMPGVALFGDVAVGLKLTSAVVGILTIPLVYGFTRTLFSASTDKGEARGVALLAALFAALSVWHIFFSRYGERVTLLVFFEVLVFWFLWRALAPLSHKTGEGTVRAEGGRGLRAFALVGLFTGLALDTYVGSRVLPVALVVLTAYAMWRDRTRARQYARGLVLAFAVAALVFLPLVVNFIFHPDQFLSHSADVSIFVPHDGVAPNIGAALTSNALKLLGMFFIAGDNGMIRNIPGRPIFDPLVGALFVVGLVTMALALFSRRAQESERRRAVFLATWILVTLAISLFTDDAPNFVRTLPAMPAVMIIPAWGAVGLWRWLHKPQLRRAVAMAVVGIVAVSGILAFRDYFVTFATDPGTYYAFNADKVETADWVKQNAQTSWVFAAPLLAQNSTISLLTRNSPLKSFESRDTIVLPGAAAGRDALYAFPLEQEKKAETWASRLGALASREDLVGSNGSRMLLIYRVRAQDLPDARDPLSALARGGDFLHPQTSTRAAFGEGLELLGYTLSPEGPGGRNLTVTLFLHATQVTRADYTFSVKVRDEQERVWGQEDKWAGDNSYATTAWSVGDVVVEKFYPGLSACAPAGNYRVSVEAYEPNTMQGLGAPIALGQFSAGGSQGNRYEDLEPEEKLDAKIDQGLQLLGYTLTPREVHPGDSFALSLFWRGIGSGATRQIEIRARDTLLGQQSVTIPGEGRGLCTLFDLRAGSDLGEQPIFVNGVKISSVNVTR